MGIVVIGAVFVDIKGFPEGQYISDGRNAGHIEYIHGGVARNVVEDIANVEMRPTFVSIVDDSALGSDVIKKLERHKVNTDYMRVIPNGMGTWLAVFDQNGDVAGSISNRPNLRPIMDILNEQGDEIFAAADAIVAEADMDRDIVKKIFALAEKYNKKVYPIVSNMSIVVEQRDLIKKFDCFICNKLEAGIMFMNDYSELSMEELCEEISRKVMGAGIPSMVVTCGADGSVYAKLDGTKGIFPARKVRVKDTTGAGDSFCAGVAMGLTYGKSLEQAVEIGTDLAASVISSSDNVCPRFLPSELGLNNEK